MTRVDFYILANSSPQARELFVCRFAEKMYKLGHSTYIHTNDVQHSQALDRLLWTFNENSFIPHALEGDTPDPEAAILIGHQAQLSDPTLAHHRQILINLAQDVPLFFSSFERVAEIIDDDENNKVAGRQRFRFYRDRGYELNNHNIN